MCSVDKHHVCAVLCILLMHMSPLWILQQCCHIGRTPLPLSPHHFFCFLFFTAQERIEEEAHASGEKEINFKPIHRRYVHTHLCVVLLRSAVRSNTQNSLFLLVWILFFIFLSLPISVTKICFWSFSTYLFISLLITTQRQEGQPRNGRRRGRRVSEVDPAQASSFGVG